MNPTGYGNGGFKCRKCGAALLLAAFAPDCHDHGEHDMVPAQVADDEWADAVFASVGLSPPTLGGPDNV